MRRGGIVTLSVVLVLGLGVPIWATGAPLHECDRLAADADDPGRVAEPVPWMDLNTEAAIEACGSAVKAQPDMHRFRYQYALVLWKADRDREALTQAVAAAEAGYAAAQWVAGMLYEWGEGIPSDPVRALEWYRKAVGQGFAPAMAALGDIYQNGNGVPRDLQRAARLYLKSALAGYGGGMEKLGEAYRFGKGVNRHIGKAIHWLQRAADEQKMGWAAYLLGKIHDHGETGYRDHGKAATWYARAVALGNFHALSDLGKMHLAGDADAEPVARAIAVARRYAERGDESAARELAAAYRKGYGVAKDPVQAVSWYLEAGERGDPSAALEVLDMREKGEANDADVRRALAVAMKAVEAGRRYIANHLGSLYHWGEGVPKDEARALGLYLREMAFGDTNAADNVIGLYREKKASSRDAARALEVVRRAAERGNAYALGHLGNYYRDGFLVDADLDTAVRWYLASARKGNPWAALSLGRLHRKGKIGAEPLAELLRWLRAEAGKGNGKALLALGHMRLEGAGLAKDPMKGLAFMERAVKAGEDDALDKLFDAYLEGLEGIAPDPAKAYFWAAVWQGQVGEDWIREKRGKAEAKLKPARITRLDRDVARWFASQWPPLEGEPKIPGMADITPPPEPEPAKVAAPVPAPTAAPVPKPTPEPARPPAENKVLVMLAQRQLAVLGFDAGPADGIAGRKTRLAVQAFQTLNGLQPDGRITKGLVEALNQAVVAHAAAPSKAAAGLPAEEAAPPAIDFGRYHALVIGNNAYRHLPRLVTAEVDARTMAAVLEKDYGFQVDLMVNATRTAIVESLDSFRARLAATDNLLVYYAGHGWLDKDAERGYWLPVDAKRDSRANWLSNATITDSLKAIRAKHVLVIADSCYSGTLGRGLQIVERSPGYLARMVRKRARLALTSGGLEPVSDSGGGRHSAFAKALLDVLRANDSVLDGTQLFSAIRRQVMLNAPQTPEYSDIRFAGHEGGDFLFVRGN